MQSKIHHPGEATNLAPAHICSYRYGGDFWYVLKKYTKINL